MIARIWRGRTNGPDTEADLRHLRETGGRDDRRAPGSRAAFLRCRPDGDRIECVTLSVRDSIDSVKALAGNAYETAVLDGGDDQFFVQPDTTSAHHAAPQAA